MRFFMGLSEIFIGIGNGYGNVLDLFDHDRISMEHQFEYHGNMIDNTLQ